MIGGWDMTATRRNFLGSASAAGLLASLFSPEQLLALQEQPEDESTQQELPHNSIRFWSGFYDAVNPSSPEYTQKGATRGSDSLADPSLETQYLHYLAEEKRLRYASAIAKEELLDHAGDILVSILLNEFRPSSTDARRRNASQLRVDTTQNHAFMNLLSPLAWTAMASLVPDKAGKLPTLDQLHFKSDQVMTASSHILLTKGSGKIAVNISQAPKGSMFVKAFNVMIQGAKMIAPIVTLPAVSIPAMSAFSEAFSFWENRTQFLINGNLVNAAATQQAMADPEVKSPSIGLLAGDYVVVAKKDNDSLHAVLPDLRVFQGYLVHKDTDLNQPVDNLRSDSHVPDVTYATIRVSVSALNSSLAGSPAPASGSDGSSAGPSSGGSKKGGTKGHSGKGSKDSSKTTPNETH
jgi:hypothetical protein